MKILILSNGHGEDLVGAGIAKKLLIESATESRGSISAIPIVGEGRAYENAPCEIVGPRKKLPGGGFSLRNLSHLYADIKNGYLGQLFEIYKAIRSQKPDLVIAVGDIIPLIGAKITRAPFIFIGVNKTDHYKWFGYSYTPWEKWLLKSAKAVFTRDQLTASNLKRIGINALFVGNPIMDVVKRVTCTVDRVPSTVGLLPGTREKDVELNLKDFKQIAERIIKSDRKIKFILAKDKPFKEILEQADVVIGLSGTGNEQAAGAGIPVISFPSLGSQYNKKFGQAQKQLLGEALLFIPERDFVKIAQKTVEILNSQKLIHKMSEAGRQRIGKSGAIRKIVSVIANAKS